jgi:hypothetical protein
MASSKWSNPPAVDRRVSGTIAVVGDRGILEDRFATASAQLRTVAWFRRRFTLAPLAAEGELRRLGLFP